MESGGIFMLKTELIKLIEDIQLKKTESNYIEVKSVRNGCPKIFDTLSSFSNQQKVRIRNTLQ